MTNTQGTMRDLRYAAKAAATLADGDDFLATRRRDNLVRLAESQGVTIPELAAATGLTRKAIRRTVHQYR